MKSIIWLYPFCCLLSFRHCPLSDVIPAHRCLLSGQAQLCSLGGDLRSRWWLGWRWKAKRWRSEQEGRKRSGGENESCWFKPRYSEGGLKRRMKQQGEKLHWDFNLWWVSRSTPWKTPECRQTRLSEVALGSGKKSSQWSKSKCDFMQLLGCQLTLD